LRSSRQGGLPRILSRAALLGAAGGAIGTAAMYGVAYLELVLLGVPAQDRAATVEAAFGGPSLAIPIGWPPIALHFLHGAVLGAGVGVVGLLAARELLSSWSRSLGAGIALGVAIWLVVAGVGGPAPSGPGSHLYLVPIGLSMHMVLGVILGATMTAGIRVDGLEFSRDEASERAKQDRPC
jgi:hypothetical protein